MPGRLQLLGRMLACRCLLCATMAAGKAVLGGRRESCTPRPCAGRERE